MTAYKSKLNNRNDLLIKGRCNFLTSIFERIHKCLVLNQFNINKRLEKYYEIKDNIVNKENAREIEDYLVEYENKIVMLSSKQLTEALTQFNEENKSAKMSSSFETLFNNNNNNNNNCSINDIFQFIFGNNNDNSLMFEIFELLKEQKVN